MTNLLIPEIAAIITANAESGSTPQSAVKQPRRLFAVAHLCASLFDGDLVEIGAFKGDTTVQLLQVAEEYDRRVLVVDPWETGTQDCYGPEHGIFLKATAPWADRLDVVRLSSQDPEAIAAIYERELCFAYVDGLHQYEPCLTDIRSVGHCRGVIAVDDIRWSSDVLTAFFQGGMDLERVALFYIPQGIREGYLPPGDIELPNEGG